MRFFRHPAMDREHPSGNAPHVNARDDGRDVMDDGVRWTVYELSDADLTMYDRRRARSLVFESEHAVRRLRDFPANWRQLPDDVLLALSWGR